MSDAHVMPIVIARHVSVRKRSIRGWLRGGGLVRFLPSTKKKNMRKKNAMQLCWFIEII